MKKKATVKIQPFIIILVAFLFVAIIAKLCYVVLSEKVDGINLEAKAASIATVERTLYADRGNIYDINGEKLAGTVNSYTVVAYLSESRTTNPDNPRHVIDKEATAKALSPIINMSEERILELLNKEAYQVELGPGGRGITETVKASIEALELPGIGFINYSKKRYYNKGASAAYIVGYAKNDDEGNIKGELGVEGYYNEILSGENGYTKFLKYTSSNYRIPNTPEETKEAKNGSDIYLTIDNEIQFIVEKAVKNIMNDFEAEWAVFSVMDANTGAIVASATNPNYNPNDIGTITKSGYLNPLVSYQYEPGSVMKIFSFATAIETGNYKGDETYKSGSYTLPDKVHTVIRDANRKGWGTITYDLGFQYSSNVAATILSLRIGRDTLIDYYRKLGFGEKTGIELSNEVVGKVDFKYLSELSNASFGQGVSITPVQMLQALSSMTNDGFTIKPYIVDKIVDSDGNITYEGKRTIVNKVYSTSTVEKMHELMYSVVNGGEGKHPYAPSTVTLMGKTGTAQYALPDGSYSTGKYDAIKSFGGMFPTDDPKYIIFVSAKKPITTSVKWGEMIATAVDEIASYAKLTEEKTDMDLEKLIDIDNYISSNVENTKINLESKKLDLVILGNGKYVIDQYPLKNNVALEGSKVFLLTNGTEFTMANLNGWSLNEVKTYCNLLGLKLEYSGYGYVTSQSILPNTVLDVKNMVLTVELKKEDIK